MIYGLPIYCILAISGLLGCAQLTETPILMGGTEYFEEPPDSTSAGSATAAVVVKPTVSAVSDSVDALAQKLLFLPFKDLTKFKGPWAIPIVLAYGLADTLADHDFLKVIPADTVLALLSKKELRGKVTREKGLKWGRELNADYVILGEIEEFATTRVQATVPLGGYRSYRGLVAITLKPFKVIDGRSTEEVKGYGETDEKLIGVTNPASYIKLEREYHLLGDIAWASEEFHDTLLGQATGACLHELAVNLANQISPPPELTVSEPKIITAPSDGQTYINVGLSEGVQNGDKFGVWDEGEELIDSGSGIYLGKALPRRIGVVQIEQVLGDHLSLVRILHGQDLIEKGFQIRAE